MKRLYSNRPNSENASYQSNSKFKTLRLSCTNVTLTLRLKTLFVSISLLL